MIDEDNVQFSAYLKKIVEYKTLHHLVFYLPNANVLNGGGNFSLGNTRRKRKRMKLNCFRNKKRKCHLANKTTTNLLEYVV